MLTLWGLKSCDSCRAAMKALDRGAVSYEFRDLRESPLSEAQLAGWMKSSGHPILNRRSTSWRALSEAEKETAATESGAISLMLANPTLIKRPILERGERVSVGWTPEIAAFWAV